MKQLKVIFSGGGTGGHIFPAVAIADEVKKLLSDAEILFVGALGKMEMEKVPKAGYRIIGLPIAGLQRKFSWSNFKLPFLILKSFFKTRKIIKDFEPHVVVGTGGFASGPLIRVATSKGIPALIQEQNSYAGLTNRILAKKVQLICVAYEGMERFFPKEKILLTGNPVRKEITNIAEKKSEGLLFFKLHPAKKTILIIGGSLGARSINEAVAQGLEQFVQNDVQILWQCGKGYFEVSSKLAKVFEANNIFVFDFIQRMDLAYAVADLVISRAGASSVSELCNAAKACILVPSPNVAEDHQTKNAMALVEKDAAVLVKDVEAEVLLVKTAIDLLGNAKKLMELSNHIKQLAYHNSAKVIAQQVLKLAGRMTS